MQTRYIWAVLCAVLGTGSIPSAATEFENYRLTSNIHDTITNAVPLPGEARQDTLYLMGGPNNWIGRFENPDGTPNWHGWTHHDPTAPDVTHWNVGTYGGDRTGANPSLDNNVAYCGDEIIESCGPGDPVGGYGNDWKEYLDWMGTVPNNTQPTTVAMDYYLSYDVEPDYDYLYFDVLRQEGWETLRTYNGAMTNSHEVFDFSVDVEDYVGPGSDQVHLRFEFDSDGAWSDEDCLWPTAGAAQIDDIAVRFNGVVQTFDDFESKEIEGNWYSVPAPGVGDFAQLLDEVVDIDECVDNYSYQVVFIDDGEVVPDLPGSVCISWCYGPGGWILNTTGGLAGPDAVLVNTIVSPAFEWPDGDFEGATLRYDIFRHEELGEQDVWPGMFYNWGVRSVDTGDPVDLEDAAWYRRSSGYYGGPDYTRMQFVVSDLLLAGRTHVQCRLLVSQSGAEFGWVGDDATPAPYYDNVAFLVYPFSGPAMSTREIDIAQDTFPERGSIDYGNLQVNWCRFDAALDISGNDPGIDPGDSIAFDISSVRGGAELTQVPRIFYKIRTNPLFNGVRSDELGIPDGDGIISGSRPGSIVLANGIPPSVRCAFDLPDTGVFYPGDQLQYYIWAEDAIDGAEVQASTLPADISQFGNFDNYLAYDSKFTVRFLPTMFSATPDDQPKILFWNDSGDSGLEEAWYSAFDEGGYGLDRDWDVYTTRAPTSGVGNGLGSRATPEHLAGYDVLLYSSGDLSAFTIVNPDPFNDESPDTDLLRDWFALGDKKAFFTGDNLAYDLHNNDNEFLTTWLGVDWQQKSLRGWIDNQTTPLVLPTSENPVFFFSEEWIAYGGCLKINTFDGVSPRAPTEWIAEFANPQGVPGGYQFPAATYYTPGSSNQIVYIPYDLGFVYEARKGEKQPRDLVSDRAQLLQDVLRTFGHGPYIPPPGVPEAGAFAARSYPNPFNPRTTIAFTLPRAGEVTLKIYNLRGEVVRTLLDQAPQPAGPGEAVWAGENDQGGQVASGVYFYEISAGEHREVAKIALVK